MEYEHEARRWGVDPDLSREELATLVDSSTVEIPGEEHREALARVLAAAGHGACLPADWLIARSVENQRRSVSPKSVLL